MHIYIFFQVMPSNACLHRTRRLCLECYYHYVTSTILRVQTYSSIDTENTIPVSNLFVPHSSDDLPDLLNLLTLLKAGNQPSRAKDPICRLSVPRYLVKDDGHPDLATEPIWCFRNVDSSYWFKRFRRD